MKIGGGRGVCVSCIFTAAVESKGVFSLQYREPVVSGHLADWRVGLPLAHVSPASFEFAFFRMRVVCKEGCIAPLPRGRKSGVVVTKLRGARLG